MHCSKGCIPISKRNYATSEPAKLPMDSASTLQQELFATSLSGWEVSPEAKSLFQNPSSAVQVHCATPRRHSRGTERECIRSDYRLRWAGRATFAQSEEIMDLKKGSVTVKE